MNEENKQETFNQASKLLEELYHSLSINIKDKNQLEKIDQGLYELIKKNYKNVIKSQLYSEGYHEDDRNFNSQQKIIQIQKQLLELKQSMVSV